MPLVYDIRKRRAIKKRGPRKPKPDSRGQQPLAFFTEGCSAAKSISSRGQPGIIAFENVAKHFSTQRWTRMRRRNTATPKEAY